MSTLVKRPIQYLPWTKMDGSTGVMALKFLSDGYSLAVPAASKEEALEALVTFMAEEIDRKGQTIEAHRERRRSEIEASPA